MREFLENSNDPLARAFRERMKKSAQKAAEKGSEELQEGRRKGAKQTAQKADEKARREAEKARREAEETRREAEEARREMQVEMAEELAALEAEYDNDDEEEDGVLFCDLFPHTELDIDLKLYTREPGRLPQGECRNGFIAHDGEDHFCFVEEEPCTARKRYRPNMSVYKGLFVNVKMTEDGELYTTFKRPCYSRDFRFADYCRDAADELYMVADLVREDGGLNL